MSQDRHKGRGRGTGACLRQGRGGERGREEVRVSVVSRHSDSFQRLPFEPKNTGGTHRLVGPDGGPTSQPTPTVCWSANLLITVAWGEGGGGGGDKEGVRWRAVARWCVVDGERWEVARCPAPPSLPPSLPLTGQ